MLNQVLPLRITRNVSTQQVGLETLVYDERRHRAFCMNATSSAVWRECNGARTTGQIAERTSVELSTPVSEEMVQLAVRDLIQEGLVEAPISASALADVSRRAVLMLPVVAAIAAPKAAQALSGCVDCAPTVKQQQRMNGAAGQGLGGEQQ
jgi:threonine synthase